MYPSGPTCVKAVFPRSGYRSAMTFRPGEAIALREMWHGRIWTVRPVIAVEDAGDRWCFFLPAGTCWRRPVAADGSALRLPQDVWELVEDTWSETNVLSFTWEGAAHAVLCFWDVEWNHAGWYVNLQEPLRRTSVGFDYMDHALDIVVAPDLSFWHWKDEEELAEAVTLGIFTAAQARAFREEGERALAHLSARVPPYDRDWPTWRPDPSWAIPALRAGWNQT